MSGGLQGWPERIIGAGFVEVNAGVATLQSSLGGVLSVTRVGVGIYEVTLRAPGARIVPANAAVFFFCSIAGQTFFQGAWTSETVLGVNAFNAAGAAADSSFNFLILQTERLGGVT